MGDGGRVYRERTWAPAWVWVVMAGACLLGVGATLFAACQQPDPGDIARGDSLTQLGSVLVGGWVLLFFVAMTSLFMCLDVEVRSDHLFISFGPVRLVRRTIRYADIESVRAATYRPIREFAGWGIRRRGRRTAWTIRGNQALVVTLHSGKVVYVGSRFPRGCHARRRRVGR